MSKKLFADSTQHLNAVIFCIIGYCIIRWCGERIVEEDFLQLGSNSILVREVCNATSHIFPWLATCISIVFLAFIIAIIILLSE